MKPEVSIITPAKVRTRDEYAWLDECIQSVLGQSFTRWEMVIMDDASLVSVGPLQQQYADEKRIRWYHTDGCGAASARNHAADQAQAPLLLPLDADDRLAPATALQRFMEVWNQGGSGLGIVYSDLLLFGQDFSRYYKAFDYDLGRLLRGTFMCVGCLHRKNDWKRLGGWRADMEAGLEDWEYWIRFGAAGVCGLHVPEPLYQYRQNPNGRMQAMRSNVQLYQENANKLRKIHINLYNGKWPQTACKGTMTAPRAAVPTVRPQNVAKTGEMVRLRYVGPRMASFRVRGYKVPGKGGVFAVEPKDAAWFLRFTGQYHIESDTLQAALPANLQAKPVSKVQVMFTGGSRVETAMPPLDAQEIVAIAEDNTVLSSQDSGMSWEQRDIATLTVREIRDLDWTSLQAEQALEAEQRGKNRKSVIAFLERRCDG